MDIAKLAGRIVGVETHFLGELLRIKRPAFNISAKPTGFSQHRKIGLPLKGQLQMVAWDAFVEGRRRHIPEWRLGSVAQVQPVDARPGPIETTLRIMGRGASLR